MIGEKCGSRCSLICGDDRILGKADWIVPPRWGEWSISCPVVDKRDVAVRKIWLGSTDCFLRIDRSTKRSESSMREGYPLPREEASVCVFVIGTRAQDLETLEALIRVYTSLRIARLMQQRCRMDPLMDSLDGRTIERRTITLDQSGLESRWNFFFLPFSRFPPPRLFAARSVEKCHLTRE